MFQLWTRRCPKHREQASYHDTNKPAENISDTEIRSEHLQQAEVLINGTDVPEADEKKKRKKKNLSTLLPLSSAQQETKCVRSLLLYSSCFPGSVEFSEADI